MAKKQVTIYTDGACSGNPGPGGWAAVLDYQGAVRELSGYMPDTTNNRMEMTAAIEALKALREPCRVRLSSDSAYLVNAFRAGWIDTWQKNGWKTAAKKPVENQDLWKCLLELMETHDVVFVKVRGHANDALNNRCDELARLQIREHAPKNGRGQTQ